MRITDIEAQTVSIPLETPLMFATGTVSERHYSITTVRTSNGHEGVGYSFAYGGAELLTKAVESVLAPMLLGEDPRDTTRLWRKLFDSTVAIGRKGVMVRAISMLDIALWDIKAKDANLPLYKLLGAYTDSVSVYASGGYYRDGKGLEGLREEMRSYVDRGHGVVKMKIGLLSPHDDAERVRVAREVIGDERILLLDANGIWDHKTEAVRACELFAPYDPYFVEEPVMPDSVDLMSAVNETISFSVAAGELEFTRYGFENLVSSGAVDILQTDATVVGGITEWLRVAHAAAARDIPMAPHWNFNLHSQLMAAVENGLWVEYFHRDTDVRVFDDLIANPLEPEDGEITLPERTGHGVRLDADTVKEHRI